jgi:hypothetical protein
VEKLLRIQRAAFLPVNGGGVMRECRGKIVPVRRRSLALLRALCAFLITLIAQPVISVSAETACYELVPTQSNAVPGAPILVNKCTGDTYILSRVVASDGKPAESSSQSFKWVPILMASPPPDARRTSRKEPSRKPATAGRNCFAFNNRTFCE